ncbi:integrin alpha-PS3-like [Amblyomma americanum]
MSAGVHTSELPFLWRRCASLAATDLDGDGIDDLLVGAPMHSIPDGQDEGRVYVFRSNGVGLYASGYLEGKRATAARFGTTIAKIGDLNPDGIQDVAIGAPYENDVGVVYIYHGSPTLGERTAYAQRIDASVVSSRIKYPLKGFGISISKGLDVDWNQYEDVETNLTLDVNRAIENRTMRGFIIHGQMRVDKYSWLVVARNGHIICEDLLVYLHESFVDPLIPFVVRLDYRFHDTGDHSWCPTCPIPDRGSPLAVTEAIPYQHGCGSDDVCRANLKLNASIIGYNGGPLVVGERRDLSLSLVVDNYGATDPAYLARVMVTLPDRVRLVNKDKLQRSAGPGTPEASFLLKLDVSQVEETFNLTAEATTTSQEGSPSDNKVVLVLSFIHEADISLHG